ncbi:MAG TPA: OstA-like protein [Chitinophagales bacterium]|nr:OstA-like protein [Chitinophagales bacterium]
MKRISRHIIRDTFPFRSIVLLLFIWCSVLSASAQLSGFFPPPPKDTVRKKKIEIIKTDSLLFRTEDLGRYRKLIGHVQVRHEDARMYCDSAIIDIDANYMTAYGKMIHVQKGDSIDLWGDYLEYFGDQKLALLKGNCVLKDKSMILTTPELTYNLDTDIGSYSNSGRLVNKGTTINSRAGYYYHRTGNAVFYHDVVLYDSSRTIYADSLRYNIDNEIAYFITKTTIIDKDSNIIVTNSGYYDTRREKAVLGDNATIKRGDATVKAATIDYDNKAKEAIAKGNVVFHDSSERTTILSNYVFSQEKNDFIKAYNDPLLISVSEDEKDTMYLSADTLLSYKIAVTDTIFYRDSIQPDSIISYDIMEDSVKIVQAYYKMKMIQGNMSAIADSLYYSDIDSAFKLYKNPVLWMDSTQITGDSIFLWMKDKEIHRADVMGNAFIIHMQHETVFDQIKGKTMLALIAQKKIQEVQVDGNAESIYFIKDKDEYNGANKSTSGFITVSFNNGEVNRIKLTGAPEAEFTPMEKIDLASFKLDGFVWHWGKKPMSKYDVIRDKAQYEKYVVENELEK